MDLSRFLSLNWRTALGCTEPASIAFAASLAASQVEGEVKDVSVRCDPRMFKNCFAVGIPNSGGKTGALWAIAIGCLLPDPSSELECFGLITEPVLREASRLLEKGVIHVDALPDKGCLYVDCRVEKTGGTGRVVVERSHTNVTLVEKNGVCLRRESEMEQTSAGGSMAGELEALSFARMIELVRTLSPEDRERLREGREMNLGIARLGTSQFAQDLPGSRCDDTVGRICRDVFYGVYARMSGVGHPVTTASGSGNKGITCSVPLALYSEEMALAKERIDEALALALLITALATQLMGTLSATCGVSNAAGIGLAAGLVLLDGGGETQVSHAVSNMVGNVAGTICDGAKIGCALKAMTAVDAAFRAASLAMRGICIPVTDGIVGASGRDSLENLGRIATRGMNGVDAEVLRIMREKLVRKP